MKVMVTGGTGFVGRHLVDALLRRGDRVTALVRSPGKGAELAKLGVGLVAGDLGNPEALRAAVRDQELVYHVAGVVAARSDAEFHEVNAEGTARLATAMAAEARDARIVLVSSMAAGGPSARGTRLLGSEVANPVTAYGRSKLAGENILRATGLRWTILRPPAVYGPGDTEMLRIFKAARLGIVPVFGDGGQELSLIYGPDLAEALIAAGESPDTLGGTYYAVHPELHTSASLVAAIGRAMGRTVRIVRMPRVLATAALHVTGGFARATGRATLLTADKAREFFAPAWAADAGPLAAAAGWRAEHDLAAGAGRTVEWYRSSGWL